MSCCLFVCEGNLDDKRFSKQPPYGLQPCKWLTSSFWISVGGYHGKTLCIRGNAKEEVLIRYTCSRWLGWRWKTDISVKDDRIESGI